jgi:hypothetical protein
MDRFLVRPFLPVKVFVGDKECLVFHDGFFYLERLTTDEINEYLSLLKNTLDHLNEVNLTTKSYNLEFEMELRNPGILEKKVKVKVPKSGDIYIIFCKRTKLYKIGFTCSGIFSRLSQLKTANPDIEIHSHFKTDDVILTESWLHNYYKDKKVSREWYELTESDLEFIKQILTKKENDVLSND